MGQTPGAASQNPAPVLAGGGKSVSTLFLTLAIIWGSLGALAVVGNAIGPLTLDHQADQPITIDGKDHTITFTLPYPCEEDTEDPSMMSFTCVDGDTEINLVARPVPDIHDIATAAKRGAREAALDRTALDQQATTSKVKGGNVASVAHDSFISGYVASSVFQTDDKSDGFVFNVSLNIADQGDDQAVDNLMSQLVQTAEIEPIKEKDDH